MPSPRPSASPAVAPWTGSVAVTQLYVAVIAAGYVVQAVGTWRTEESRGRVETRLVGSLSRTRWLCAHALVVLGGLVTIVLGSSLVLGRRDRAVGRRHRCSSVPL